MIKGIGHTAYTVADMKASLHFYCDILGFYHAFSIPDDQGNPWIEYLKVNQNSFIELFYNREGENTPASYSHLCLEVDDIDEIARRLEENGVTLDAKPSQGKDKNWQCWAKDPDGNRIEFMQMHPDSPQMRCINCLEEQGFSN